MKLPISLQELALFVDGEIEGDSALAIHALNGLEYAQSGEITFILTAAQLPLLACSQASACIIPIICPTPDRPAIRVAHPALAAAHIHQVLLRKPFVAGIHPTAVIEPDCQIPEKISIGPLAYLAEGVTLEEGVRIGAGSILGKGVRVGADTILHPRVTVAEGCRIGARVIIHSGAVIGADGFGFVTDANGRHHKKPQVGVVCIDDEVEIGANTCIDRAAFGSTWIKRGVKIDNLVMIGHNVVIGEHSIIVAQTGIAGSTTLGRNVVLGGQVGVAGHLHLDDGVMAAAQSGIHNNQPRGARIGGAPAFEVKQWGRAVAIFHRLPEMFKEIKALRREINLFKGPSQAAVSDKEDSA